MKRISMVLFAFAIGCGGSQPSQPKAQHSTESSALPAKPSAPMTVQNTPRTSHFRQAMHPSAPEG